VSILKISEIFYSIQGEGYNAGLPAVFVRFYGCNLNCPWCDTPYARDDKGSYRMLRTSAILREIAHISKGCKNVIITGGEPTFQRGNLFELCNILRLANYWVGVETNGTGSLNAYIDWITVSPKSKKDLYLKAADEVKVVWTGKEDLCWFKNNIKANYYYLQPCSGKNIKETIKKVKENPEWRLSVQMHKILSIR